MTDDNAVMEGCVKFRDGKKWKSRWCVMRKLSPVADCLHLQLYRDSKERYKKTQSKASLSLQHFLGFESGFTLDKESNTIAIICQDIIVVLAFDTRERLIQWQVKIANHLGESFQYLVLVSSAPNKAKISSGPAKLHVQNHKFCMTTGVPPRLLGLWEIAHLRRYGVVESRFCFEGGSHCGKGEGLHVLITDQGDDITNTFNMASHAQLTIRRRIIGSKNSTACDSPKSKKGFRPDTRLSDLNTIDKSLVASEMYEDAFLYDESGAISPYWPSAERGDMDMGDTASVSDIRVEGTGEFKCNTSSWINENFVTIERCISCMSKLGAMSRSSTTAFTPGAHFTPAWTMESVAESKPSTNEFRSRDEVYSSSTNQNLFDVLGNNRGRSVLQYECLDSELDSTKTGPYENYDIPKVDYFMSEEYYDTPKRLKECISEDVFKPNTDQGIQQPKALLLKKQCGCLLKLGKQKTEPVAVVIDCDEEVTQLDCPCSRVTEWANSWINIPYCKRTERVLKPNKENLKPNYSKHNALYATVDVTKKTNKQQPIIEANSCTQPSTSSAISEPNEIFANYENLDFAISLEYYENAKSLLKKAGISQTEIDALSKNLHSRLLTRKSDQNSTSCSACGQTNKKTIKDDYLMMQPAAIKRYEQNIHSCLTNKPSSGYTQMSPITQSDPQTIGNTTINRIIGDIKIESEIYPKTSGSYGPPVDRTKKKHEPDKPICVDDNNSDYIKKQTIQSEVNKNRSNSEDSSRFEIYNTSNAAISSSLETLTGITRRNSSSLRVEYDYYDGDSCGNKSSCDAESETTSKELPQLRKKDRNSVQMKRSLSVPCKTGANRDSSSSNDSGVSSCGATGSISANGTMWRRGWRRRCRSSDACQLQRITCPVKSTSAEAEVPVCKQKQLKGVVDTNSTSSGTSDMSDYIETLSLTSSQSSTDTPSIMRINRQATNTLRPRSGKEYHNIDSNVIIRSVFKTNNKKFSSYTNIP